MSMNNLPIVYYIYSNTLIWMVTTEIHLGPCTHKCIFTWKKKFSGRKPLKTVSKAESFENGKSLKCKVLKGMCMYM